CGGAAGSRTQGRGLSLPGENVGIVVLPHALNGVEFGTLLLPCRFSGRLLLLGRHLVPLRLGRGGLRLEFGGLSGGFVRHVISLANEFDRRKVLEFLVARRRERRGLLFRRHLGPLRLRRLILRLVLSLLFGRHRGLAGRDVGFVIRCL